jgi:poly-gamma-glutamate synthesis protein (capsule biosynthesis protein)
LEPLGAYPTPADASKGYTIRTVQGVKIAFVAFTKGMDGMALPAGNEGCVNVLYEDYATDYRKVDTANITRILSAAEKEKPDLTVAMLHWGSEFNDNVSQSQENILKMLYEQGVDVVIGTHSHYVQKMALDMEKGTFLAYSLGDFVGTERAGSEYSVVLDLEIVKDLESGKTTVNSFQYTPIFTVDEEGKPLRVVRIAETMKAFDEDYLDSVSQETYDAMTYALKRIEDRIKAE